MSRLCTSECAVETCSTTDSSVDNTWRKSETDTYSDRNSSTRSTLSELAIYTLVVETRLRDLDKEEYQDTDNDRYLVPSEKTFDNTADDLEMIAVSKLSMSPLPQKEAVRTNIQLFKQETEPMAKIWCVKSHENIFEVEIQTLGPNKSAEKRPHNKLLEKVGRNWGTRQKGSGRGWLPNLETKIYTERMKISKKMFKIVISKQGSNHCLQNERGGQGLVQIQSDINAATLSKGIFIQVT